MDDNKIFITLGSQKFQFNRLLKAVDELCEKGTVDAEDVFAQIGYRKISAIKSFWIGMSLAMKWKKPTLL